LKLKKLVASGGNFSRSGTSRISAAWSADIGGMTEWATP